MDGLRIALLVIGAVIVAGIYWNARRKHAADIHNTDVADRIEPAFDDTSEPIEPAVDAQELPLGIPTPEVGEADPLDTPAAPLPDVTPDQEKKPAQADTPQKVISLRIVGKAGADFAAEEVVLTLRGVGLQHGKFGIFHRISDEEDEALFSVANLTEPGTFDLADLKERRFAGLSFFMLRPGPGRGVDAFDKMVEMARAVAITLQGELLDGDGSTLSIQRERFMREDLIQYELKHLKL
ncbi:MAG: cell division protein ZipA C-terminal FtsZ-binding domain-containing protein [Pseudomonadota bacterium]